MIVKRGDIVLIDFPYSDRTGGKIRPALVVQSDIWNLQIDDTILAVITSSQHRRVGVSTQYSIDISTIEGQQTGLHFNSIVQCENLITQDQKLILQIISRLSDSAMQQIDICLKSVFGIC
jgi:mRNA interferase MazF